MVTTESVYTIVTIISLIITQCFFEFDGGVTVNFSIEAFTSYSGRRTRIMGTRGDIVGDMEQFVHTGFCFRQICNV